MSTTEGEYKGAVEREREWEREREREWERGIVHRLTSLTSLTYPHSCATHCRGYPSPPPPPPPPPQHTKCRSNRQ